MALGGVTAAHFPEIPAHWASAVRSFWEIYGNGQGMDFIGHFKELLHAASLFNYQIFYYHVDYFRSFSHHCRLDCSGGAGIQTDIKTISRTQRIYRLIIYCRYGTKHNGVQAVCLSPGHCPVQITSVMDDLRPAAIKIGMVHKCRYHCTP